MAGRASCGGELCVSAVLGAGDALAIGRPGDEALLATLHAVATDEAGVLLNFNIVALLN